MQNSQHVVKLIVGSDVRLIRVSDFKELVNKVTVSLGHGNFKVLFKDEENDLVTISSEMEFEEVVASSSTTSLRLIVRINGTTTPDSSNLETSVLSSTPVPAPAAAALSESDLQKKKQIDELIQKLITLKTEKSEVIHSLKDEIKGKKLKLKALKKERRIEAWKIRSELRALGAFDGMGKGRWFRGKEGKCWRKKEETSSSSSSSSELSLDEKREKCSRRKLFAEKFAKLSLSAEDTTSFQAKLAELEEAGFNCRRRNAFLLMKYNGDAQLVKEHIERKASLKNDETYHGLRHHHRHPHFGGHPHFGTFHRGFAHPHFGPHHCSKH